jgi:hypothetical protein
MFYFSPKEHHDGWLKCSPGCFQLPSSGLKVDFDADWRAGMNAAIVMGKLTGFTFHGGSFYVCYSEVLASSRINHGRIDPS